MSSTHTVLDWLLESPTPTIRYLTMRQLLGYPAENEQAKAEYAAIQNSHPLTTILAKQILPGRWQHPEYYYSPKYRSTHWTLMLLQELNADPYSSAFQDGVEFMLASSLERVEKYSKANDPGFTCLFGNIIRYAIYAGFLADTRTQTMIELVTNSLTKADCSCKYNTDLPCSWGAARSLSALAAIPSDAQTPATQQAIQSGIEFLLEKYSLVDANYPHPQDGKIHALWSQTSFPLFYQADILFVLRVLKALGQINLPQVTPAKEWLKARQNQRGRWSGSSPFQSRTWSLSSDKADTARWVTLQALDVLQEND